MFEFFDLHIGYVREHVMPLFAPGANHLVASNETLLRLLRDHNLSFVPIE